MFYGLFSDFRYEEEFWPAVLKVETGVIALFHSDFWFFVGLSDEDLKKLILERLHTIWSLTDESKPPVDRLWVNAFLAREIRPIQAALAGLAGEVKDARDLSVSHPLVAPKMLVIKECMESSQRLRSYMRQGLRWQ